MPLPDDRTDLGIAPAELAGDSFDTFWKTYPRKVGKRNAQTAYKKALRRDGAQAILKGALAYRNDPRRDPEYTSHPATWLNGDRWLDEFSVPARSEVPPVDLTQRFEQHPEGITFAEWLADHASDEDRARVKRLGLKL